MLDFEHEWWLGPPVITPLLTFAGAATWDALALVDRYPGADERVVASEVAFAGGGPAATAAVAAARLGHRTAFCGAVGADEEGERIVDALREEGVDTSGVTVIPTMRSGASLVVVASATATRAISNRPLRPADPFGSDAGRELLAASAWVHVDHLGWPALMAGRSAESAANPPQLSYDGGHLLAGFTCAGLDVFAPTLQALQARYGDRPAAELVDAARREGAAVVVATDGANGCHLLDLDGRYSHVPGFKVDVVSTLGAGDVFHGALVASLAAGNPPVEAARRANAAAALSCRALDGRSAIPTSAELDKFFAHGPHSQADIGEPARSLV